MHGVGLGLRRHFIHEIAEKLPAEIDWFEIAPENYIDRGGAVGHDFEIIASHYPLIGHGLSLSIGSTDELHWDFLKKIKKFLRQWKIPRFSDHLCFSSFKGRYFHDLLPLPFTWEAVHHVSERARIVQDFLELPFALENISFYLFPEKQEMTELEFILEILERSGVGLLLDINNVYVNSINHQQSAEQFLKNMASVPICHLHMAGHHQEPDGIIDTHGEAICKEVWQLLRFFGTLRALPPILIERDHNFPELSKLIQEIDKAKNISSRP